MNYLKAIGLLLLQPFKLVGQGLLGFVLMCWVFSGFGFLFLVGDYADHDKLTLLGWSVIVVDGILLIGYCINFIKDKAQELK